MTEVVSRFPENSEMGIMIRYLALRTPRGVNKLASFNGYPIPDNDSDSRVEFLNRFLLDNEEGGIESLMSIHPDIELLSDVIFSGHSDMGFDNLTGVTDVVKGVSDLGNKSLDIWQQKASQGKQATKYLSQQQRGANIQSAIASKQEQEKLQHKTVVIAISVIGLLLIVGLLIYVYRKK